MSMRKMTGFKGCKSIIKHSAITVAFETIKAPEPGQEPTLDEILTELGRVMPFPDVEMELQITRKAG
jgi:hypothetical protein